MRIALVTLVRSRIGGTESYVEQLALELFNAGHEIALWHEYDGPPGRGLIALPPGTPSWSAESLGRAGALAGLRDWQPTVLFSHGVSTPEVEALLLALAPTVMFVHAYHGACISGTKSRLSPTRTPCPRPLGAPCLLHYFPRRCGGWSPVTMVRRYSLTTRQRDMLPRYEAILTASSHMRKEYLKYDLPSDRVHAVGLMIPQRAVLAARQVPGSSSSDVPGERDISRTWRLLFVARLTPMKGGAMLLKTLPLLRKMFSGRIVLTVAGEGPDRPSMEADASRLRSKDPHLHIRFAGWLGPDEIAAALRATDLLVVPSIWPEPFGLVGPEAGIHAVPSAAFAVGGIPDWLRDGVNGHVAPGDPPTAEGLADAITRSLVSADHHMRLCAGALAQAAELNPERHIPRVVGILAQAVAARQGRELA